MLQQLFKKWWVLLLQGILLIVLSVYIFNNPVEVLAGISFWFGIMVGIAGLIGVISWVASGKDDKENMFLFWSLFTLVFGLLMVFNLMATMKTITVIFGIWVLFTGIHLFKHGWDLKSDSRLGWIMVVAGGASIAAAIMMIFNLGAGSVAISTLLGLQVLLAGAAMILLAIAKKTLTTKVKNKLNKI
jgi:uncharacterized membrane protein HdeD (DUF308 family)